MSDTVEQSPRRGRTIGFRLSKELDEKLDRLATRTRRGRGAVLTLLLELAEEPRELDIRLKEDLSNRPLSPGVAV
jgi:predicted DNA-binding protein